MVWCAYGLDLQLQGPQRNLPSCSRNIPTKESGNHSVLPQRIYGSEMSNRSTLVIYILHRSVLLKASIRWIILLPMKRKTFFFTCIYSLIHHQAERNIKEVKPSKAPRHRFSLHMFRSDKDMMITIEENLTTNVLNNDSNN